MTTVSINTALSMLDGYLKNTIQNEADLSSCKREVKQDYSIDTKNKQLGLMTKQVLSEHNIPMKLSFTKRASSESSIQRLQRRENKPIAHLGQFPSVENAVRHFRTKMDSPKVVSVSIPLNKRHSYADNSDEHRLKYHHRSVDELEKISHDSDRLRAVIDDEIDLDYIDIVYEANKPSKQHYMSLSCAPPLMPKYFTRRIKLQQRADSRDSSAKDLSENVHDDSPADKNDNVPQQVPAKDNLSQNITEYENSNIGSLKTYNDKISVQIEYKSNNSAKHSASTRISLPTNDSVDTPSTPYRYSYFSKTNGYSRGINRANTRDLRKVFRYSKHINHNFRAKN